MAFISIFFYVLIERRLRERPWGALGFKPERFREAVAANRSLILLVSVVSQLAPLLIGMLEWTARVPRAAP